MPNSLQSGRNQSIDKGRLYATFVPTAGTSTVSEVLITVVDNNDQVVPGLHVIIVYLSDSPQGAGITATTTSGAVAVKTSSGYDFGVLTTKKVLQVMTLATGKYTLSITDSARTTFYVCALLNGSHLMPEVSTILATADYGA